MLIIALNTLSLLLIASMQRAGEYNYLRTQSIALCIGIVGAFMLSVIDYKFLRKFWWLAAIAGVGLIGVVFIYGITVEGTDDMAWINIGGFSLQPSEIVKVCFIVTLSAHLSWLMKSGKITDFLNVCLLAVHGALPVMLIHLQGDDGAALVFALMFVVMCFAAGVQLRYFVILAIAAAAAVPLLWTVVFNDDQKNRLRVLLSADDSMLQTYGWQQYQGKVSIASGGLFGKGYFQGSRVAREVVPYQENDFIFTVAGEELGFVGCVVILLLFVLLILRIMRNAAKSQDALGKNICMGFASILMIQTIVNLGMVLGLLPVIGITLPFFSAGGSSAACLYLGVGLVQSVCMSNRSLVHIENHWDNTSKKLHV